MSRQIQVYADAETLVQGFLGGLFPSARLTSKVPTDLVGALPVIQVLTIGGADTDVALDQVRMDVECFADNYDDAALLARQVRAQLRFGLPGYAVAGATVSATTAAPPVHHPYSNTNVERFFVAAVVTIHNQ